MAADVGRVRELFDRAIELAPSERAKFLAGAGELRGEVESLLEFHARAHDYLEAPVAYLPTPETPSAEAFFAPRELEPGAQVGAYVVRELLGEGGMGVVYRAEQRAPVRREVALKVLKADAEFGDEAGRFALESQALALMDHANVARVFDAGTTTSGRPYFAMELVRGVAITRYCDERRLGVRARLALFVQVCRGVEHAHQRGVIHRDLKPSNVLVSESDGAPLAKIIDFGVAKALVRGLTEHTLRTSFGTLIGTPDYMSPEQAASEGRDVDARTDVYALGVVMYELLCGALPYEFRARNELTFLGVQRALADEEPTRPSKRVAREPVRAREVAHARSTSASELMRELASDLDWIVMRAIDKERPRRYASAAELADDVERVLANEAVLAAPPSALHLARKFARRNRGWLAIVACLVLGLVATLYMALEAARAREIARARSDYLAPLADFARWSSLREDVDRLWPAEASKVALMDGWLARASDLMSRHDEHAALLATFDTELVGAVRLPSIDGTFEELGQGETRAYVQLIARLVRGMERIGNPTGVYGSVIEMRRRREFALALERRSLIEPADAWRRAIASIADRGECPRYDGFELTPQLGLVPLGRDEQTGLWEFGHLPTGALPEVDSAGVARVIDATGLVLVLVPAAAPFFVSKYELTQSQWARLFGRETRRPDREEEIESLELTEALNVLGRARLALPSDAQVAALADFPWPEPPPDFPRTARLNATVSAPLGLRPVRGVDS